MRLREQTTVDALARAMVPFTGPGERYLYRVEVNEATWRELEMGPVPPAPPPYLLDWRLNGIFGRPVVENDAVPAGEWWPIDQHGERMDCSCVDVTGLDRAVREMIATGGEPCPVHGAVVDHAHG